MKNGRIFIAAEEIDETVTERYGLALNRIREIKEVCFGGTDNQEPVPVMEELDKYFRKTAGFLMLMAETFDFIENGEIYEVPLEELSERNRKLYEDILPENYDMSYANPVFAAARLGDGYGQLLSFLYAELRAMIAAAYEQDRFEMTIRMELFLEIFSAFSWEWAETGTLPGLESLRQIIYWFVSDYSETETQKRLKAQLAPEDSLALRIIMGCDLSNPRYLYYFGEYITEGERKTAEHLNNMPKEKLSLMADTYTEGYRTGFAVCNKDIGKKKTVNIRYCLGFERMIRQAVENFGKMGMQSIIYRAGTSIFHGLGMNRNGYYGAIPNKQYDYDHKDDQALYLDSQFINRRLEATRAAFESLKKEAALFGGPAVVEIFGETPFVPENRKEALQLSEKQKKLSVEYLSAAMTIQNEYIKGEERSFTIIAFPVPAIGDKFEEIFDETVRINTLDSCLYREIQQTIIDVLDQAAFVTVRGMGKNRTSLKINLHELKDPDKETNFENCVADVNIPVGEVFTSPVLSGTEGILHVSSVFLGELEYRDLQLTFKDGMIVDYDCANFERPEENKKYIKENVLHNHVSLPMGEFAIGTNTVAYIAARKYGMESRLPILIAEKMGPHFAVGDTCYSHEEELKSFNPDKKAIIARENEVSALRKTEPEHAYFNCHTDITIPYDELGELSAVTADNRVTVIIADGRFVLDGCEELNKPFEEPS